MSLTIYLNGNMGKALHVSEVIRDAAGVITQAYVDNGGWLYRRDGDDHTACEQYSGAVVTRFAVTVPTVEEGEEEKEKVCHEQSPELYGAEPDCTGRVICAPGGGIKCTKCRGWFCY